MKRLFFIAMFILSSISIYAQEDVTKFLGIPVDGTKPEMIKKLIEKGYTYDKYNDCLMGEFNGQEVIIGILTNNNKVYRIAVADKNTRDEAQIKIRFNTLYQQFENNSKYFSPYDNVIPEDENISYEMIVNHKAYQAAFYQTSTKSEDILNDISTKLASELKSKYTGEQLENLSEEKIKIELDSLISTLSYFQNQVWFTILQDGSRYRIVIYYENLRNKANGEDL